MLAKISTGCIGILYLESIVYALPTFQIHLNSSSPVSGLSGALSCSPDRPLLCGEAVWGSLAQAEVLCLPKEPSRGAEPGVAAQQTYV